MKEVLLKSLVCLLAVILLISVFTANSYSYEPKGTDGAGGSGTVSSSSNFDLRKYGNDAKPSAGTDTEQITKATTTVATIAVSAVRILGTGIALIMITVIAMKYMVASPGQRAEIKKSSIQYVVGAIIVFGSTQILGMLIKFFPGLVNSK